MQRGFGDGIDHEYGADSSDKGAVCVKQRQTGELRRTVIDCSSKERFRV